MVELGMMLSLPTRRQRALLWRSAPSALFVAFVMLPLAVVVAFGLFALLVTKADFPGVEVATDGLTMAMTLVLFIQGNTLLVLISLGILSFICSISKPSMVLRSTAAHLRSGTPVFVRVWRAIQARVRTVFEIWTINSLEYRRLQSVRGLTEGFLPGTTPQLE